MGLLRPAMARAYVNHGRWLADCPAPDCFSAHELTGGQFMWHCEACGLTAEIEWPPAREAYEIWKALSGREATENRNWYPAGHETALLAGLPHGLSAAELVGETLENLARIESEQRVAAEAAGREEIFAEAARLAREAREERNERWADEGHPPGGPAVHPFADEGGFPPEHAVTRGEGQMSPECHCAECKTGGK